MPTSKSEVAIRLACFFGTLLAMTVWELVAPRRPRTQSRSRRWSSNLGLALLNNVAWRLLIPAGAVGIAVAVESRGWGLFNHIAGPEWAKITVSIVLFDFALDAQHWVFHRVPWLWRLHLVHHVDLDFDATTGVRFHTVETLISSAWKAAIILLLGTPALAVMIFEILLNATSMFSHSNIRMPDWLDRLLRLVLVTPDQHRVHHSVERHETNSNFGFCLSWWDRLFRTYHAQPDAGHEDMTIGQREYRDSVVERLPFMLCLPFQRQRPLSQSHRTDSNRH